MAAKKTLLILDFDRTVFNLEKFLADLQEHLWELPPIPAEDSKTHQLFKNPQNYTDADRKRLEHAFNVLPAHDYTYADVAPMLTQLPPSVTPIILTRSFAEAYQFFKHRFTPAIEQLPFHVTLENKGLLIASSVKRVGDELEVNLPHLQGKFHNAVLVDDNPKQFEPILAAAAPVRLIHMDRPGEKYTGTANLQDGVSGQISSLAELPALLA